MRYTEKQLAAACVARCPDFGAMNAEEQGGVRDYVARFLAGVPEREPMVPGTKEAVVEAVRLLCGEAPTYLEDSDQWTLPVAPDALYDAVRGLVRWLDDHATKGDG
jgi:hypothetical protein